MPSELDKQMDAITGFITGEDGPLKVGPVERGGASFPAILTAPPTLGDYFAYFCNEHKDTTFIVDGDERLTFSEVYAAARKVAGGLIEGYAIQKGDRVGIAARNATGWIVSFMGIAMAGGVATLLNGWWQSAELAAGIDNAGCKLVIADAPRAKRIVESGVDVPIVIIDFEQTIEGTIAPLLAKGGGADTGLPTVAPDDHATILFTSGSTGLSKGAISDHRGVIQGAFSFLVQILTSLEVLKSRNLEPTLQPTTLLNVPLFHVTALIPVFLLSMPIGRKLVIMPKWDAEEAMRLIEKEKVTYFVGVPLMSYEIMVHPNRQKYDISSCTDFAAGGAPRPVEHVKRLFEEMNGARALIGYGLTETNAVGCNNIMENYLNKPNSSGRAAKPLVEFGIFDDDGNQLPQGERGEIGIRSIANILGYWNNDAATKAAFTDDGWFKTGDIGYLDEDGYLFIVDRKKDIIIRGGENISCAEVEAAIYEHPAVSEVAVFGLNCERLGEEPAAVVYVHPGHEMTPTELKEFLKEHLAGFKIPSRIWISTDPLPRLGTEKIDKVGIKKLYSEMA